MLTQKTIEELTNLIDFWSEQDDTREHLWLIDCAQTLINYGKESRDEHECNS